MIKKYQNTRKNYKTMLSSIFAITFTFLLMFILVRLEEKLQLYIFDIDREACIFYSLRGITGLITSIATLIFCFFSSATLITLISDKKIYKKILLVNIVTFLILIGSLFFSIQHYQFIMDDGIYIRDSFFEDENRYTWDKIIKVNGYFYSTIKNGEHFTYIFEMADGKIYSETFNTRDSKSTIKTFDKLIKEKNLKFDLETTDIYRYKILIN